MKEVIPDVLEELEVEPLCIKEDKQLSDVKQIIIIIYELLKPYILDAKSRRILSIKIATEIKASVMAQDDLPDEYLDIIFKESELTLSRNVKKAIRMACKCILMCIKLK